MDIKHNDAPSPDVLVWDEGPVRRIVINRDHVRNALNDGVLDAIRDALEGAADLPDIRAIVLSGAGTSTFCAGGDLKPGAATFEYDYSIPKTAFGNLLRTALTCPIPLIARVNGHCMAGGMGLLAMCDMAVTSDQAKFGLPEVKIGMFPMQVAAVLQDVMLPRNFAELCLTGEPIDAGTARTLGLVNYVVPAEELDAQVDWLLSRILDKSPTAIRRGKYALRAIRDMTVEQAIGYMENQLTTLSLTADSKEGLASFNERRAPVWTGR